MKHTSETQTHSGFIPGCFNIIYLLYQYSLRLFSLLLKYGLRNYLLRNCLAVNLACERKERFRNCQNLNIYLTDLIS